MDERLRREQEFHDARFTEGHSRPSDRFYAINAASDAFFRRVIEEMPPGTKTLDYGCGEGSYAALHAAQHGHDVTAIDLSPVAIEQSERIAREGGVADNIEFRVMNAEELEFEADSFDLVCGLGVLHHLDLAKAIGEVARVMRPDGGGVFVEPLGHNPVINFYRRRTPDERSEDEHPLLMNDFEVMGARFQTVELEYFHLLGLLALPFTQRSWFDGALSRLDAADRILFRTAARRWAWIAGIRLSAPSPV